MLKFSFIIPVYNVESYLNECINSLIEQEYPKSKYEIILVDDESKDKSGEICDEYERKYNNIKVIHKKNGGLSDTRNCGIKASSGEYLLFIDSDDYIDDKRFLKDVDKIVMEKSPELIVFGRKKYYEKSKQFSEFTHFENIASKTIIESALSNNFFKASACDKIIKRDLLINKNLFFVKGMTGEDIKWCGDVLKNVNISKIEIYNNPVYVYRQRQNSISHSGVNQKNMLLLIDMFSNEIENGSSENIKIVNSYYAYEYAVRLGKIYLPEMRKFDRNYKKKMIDLNFVLNFDLSNKVRKINKMRKIVGIIVTARLLALYIMIKNIKK